MTTKILFAMAVTLASTSAFALTTLECTAGEESDGYRRIFLSRKGLEIQMSESGLDASPRQVKRLAKGLWYVNARLKGEAEGVPYESKVVAFLVHKPREKQVVLTMALDGEVTIQGETLNCK